jgi:uncharacterized repeat protein (TIGR03803 family)
MHSQKVSIGFTVLLAIIAVVPFMSATHAVGQTEKLLHSFGASGDGEYLLAGLAIDDAGNLYGTTVDDTINGDRGGTVFELKKGCWTEKLLHRFGNGTDGYSPNAGLILDAAGNLYGTTSASISPGGIVFELSPTVHGWREKILHRFASDEDGLGPSASLIFDAAGNLYGTTSGGGGAHAIGTVFELSPTASGDWTEKILHAFNEKGTDGLFPVAGLILDASGNLYGTTEGGGTADAGTVFELSPVTDGGWKEKILHNFAGGEDGVGPQASLIFDAAGNLYGTTASGGNSATCLFTAGCGIVYELTLVGDGVWTETVLHSFNGSSTDGAIPEAGVILDASGNLYGTTENAGSHGAGTVFELSPAGDGSWTEKILHSFNSYASDGSFPAAGLIFDAAGNLYGTTALGGVYGIGSVFEITP